VLERINNVLNGKRNKHFGTTVDTIVEMTNFRCFR